MRGVYPVVPLQDVLQAEFLTRGDLKMAKFEKIMHSRQG